MGEDLFLIVQLICLSTMLSFAGAGTNSAMVVGHNGVMLMPVAPEANQVGRTSINFLLQRGLNHGEIGMFFFCLVPHVFCWISLPASSSKLSTF